MTTKQDLLFKGLLNGANITVYNAMLSYGTTAAGQRINEWIRAGCPIIGKSMTQNGATFKVWSITNKAKARAWLKSRQS